MPLAFRQFLMTNFLSAEFILAFWRANLKISAKCRVQGAVFNAEIFSAVQKHCPPENCRFTIRQSPFATRCRFAIRYSPFTIRCLFTSRQSLFAIRCRFSRPADLPTSRFA